MCLPFGPAICAACAASSSDSTTIPICCTNDNSPFFVASIASSSGSINCCIATLIATGFSSCFRSLTAALFFTAAPLPLGAQSAGRPDSQAGEEPPLIHEFNRHWGNPPFRPRHGRRDLEQGHRLHGKLLGPTELRERESLGDGDDEGSFGDGADQR